MKDNLKSLLPAFYHWLPKFPYIGTVRIFHSQMGIVKYTFSQSGRGHRDDRAKNRSKISQRFDHNMGSRGRFETFDI